MKKNVFLLTLFLGVFSIYPSQNQLGEAIVESPIENSFTDNDSLRRKMIENLSFILEKINDKKYISKFTAKNYYKSLETSVNNLCEDQKGY